MSGLTTRQYARLVNDWVASIGLDPLQFDFSNAYKNEADVRSCSRMPVPAKKRPTQSSESFRRPAVAMGQQQKKLPQLRKRALWAKKRPCPLELLASKKHPESGGTRTRFSTLDTKAVTRVLWSPGLWRGPRNINTAKRRQMLQFRGGN